MRLHALIPIVLAAGAVACAVSSPAPAVAAARNARVATAHGPKPVLPFIRDDYPKAVALARARKVPLFIEAWAPW